MIDLTPLDVRKKHEDFKRILRGFDPQEVQTFLEMVAERMEELVRANLQLSERSESLQQQVDAQIVREKAVQDALVTAQELRSDMRTQSQREADAVLAEAQTEARRLRNEAEAEVRSMLRDAERKVEQATSALREMERRRGRFLKAFRQLLERELDVVQVEEEREPLEDRTIELDLGGGRGAVETPEPVVTATAGDGPGEPEGEGPSAGEEAGPQPVSEAVPGSASEAEVTTGPTTDDEEQKPTDYGTLFMSLGGAQPEDKNTPG